MGEVRRFDTSVRYSTKIIHDVEQHLKDCDTNSSKLHKYIQNIRSNFRQQFSKISFSV